MTGMMLLSEEQIMNERWRLAITVGATVTAAGLAASLITMLLLKRKTRA
ncbi:hypothetical protein BMYO_0857 [Bifidobacterium myosotis]|uniref:Uncharacterized protein n=1 Tax=Bifidobacterium myosotis TaxID=1630166 RepID=A0A261FNJ8_9BIFI|nr:hypothetical protein [Bifidobacterium myosotis]OZG60396.1 hypothetical protein BMYO_0857 [Bifidobacterium myosotis]